MMETGRRQFEVWARIRSGRLSVCVFGPSVSRETVAAWAADFPCEHEQFASSAAAETAARNLVSDPEFCGVEFAKQAGTAGRIAGDTAMPPPRGRLSKAEPLRRRA